MSLLPGVVLALFIIAAIAVLLGTIYNDNSNQDD
jgi:hypothetical protein